MSRIEKGDVVMIVKPLPCCGSNDAYGNVFTAGSVRMSSSMQCTQCNTLARDVLVVERPDKARHLSGKLYVIHYDRLKKIEPPAGSNAAAYSAPPTSTAADAALISQVP